VQLKRFFFRVLCAFRRSDKILDLLSANAPSLQDAGDDWCHVAIYWDLKVYFFALLEFEW